MWTRFFVPSGILCLLVGPAALFAQANSPQATGKTQQATAPSVQARNHSQPQGKTSLASKPAAPKAAASSQDGKSRTPAPWVEANSDPLIKARQWRKQLAEDDWARRNLDQMVAGAARGAWLKVVTVADDATTLSDTTDRMSGLKAYGFRVPGKGKLEVELVHPKQGWFRVVMMDRYGALQPGLLQNRGKENLGRASFHNPKDEPQAIYLLVDDPALWTIDEPPYQLTIRRSWASGSVDLSGVKLVEGLWGK